MCMAAIIKRQIQRHFMLRKLTIRVALLLLLSSLLLSGCQREYLATFDEIGAWAQDDRADVVGGVEEGRYVMHLLAGEQPRTYWASAGETFADGIFEVDVTQLKGDPNTGFGLAFRVNEELGQFYLFEISADGYAWVGLCKNGCLNETDQLALLGNWWFPSNAIRQGLNETNQLRVVADGPNMIFYINGLEIGRINDAGLAEGDIALVAESLGAGDFAVAFDNVRVTPLEE